MSTVLENETVVAEKLGKPSRSAIKEYRQSVFDNVCDAAINFAARRIDAEWQQDRKTFERRQCACESLQIDLPALEAAANDAAKTAAQAEEFARALLPDNATIGQLRERIRAANEKALTGTPIELANALQFLSSMFPDGQIGRLKSAAIRSRGAISDCRDRARQTLIETADNTEPDPALAKVGARIEEVKHRIGSRREVLEAEAKVPLVKRECEQLARGDRPPSYSSVNQPGQQPTPLATLYRAARRKLDELFELVAAKPDAEKANAADEAELQRLQAKAAEAHQAALLRLCQPENMRWTGGE